MSTSELNAEKENSIYELIGGAPAIGAAVEAFYARVLADSSLKRFFAKTDMKWLRERQVQFFTTALGGPALYKGPDMKRAHAHLPIEQKHFDTVAGHLITTLKSLNVSDALIQRIISAIAPLSCQIVNTNPTKLMEER